MITNALILRIPGTLEILVQWDSIIQLASVLAAWLTIMFLLLERREMKRPYLQITKELVRSSLACIVIRNVGNCPLDVTSLVFSEDFTKQLDEKTKERITKLRKTEIIIFPNRFYVLSLDVTTGHINNKYDTKNC